MPRRIILDCDPGHDDAIALLLALASPELELLGVTTVAGNQTLPKTTANAIRTLELVGRADVPVAAGADRPLVRDARVAVEVHGESGLDGPDLPPAQGSPLDRHAVDFLRETLAAADRPVTLVPVGPLTNIALLLARAPESAEKIERVVGGATIDVVTDVAADAFILKYYQSNGTEIVGSGAGGALTAAEMAAVYSVSIKFETEKAADVRTTVDAKAELWTNILLRNRYYPCA